MRQIQEPIQESAQEPVHKPKKLSHIYTTSDSKQGLKGIQRELYCCYVKDVLSGANFVEQFRTRKEREKGNDTAHGTVLQILRSIQASYSSGGMSKGRSTRYLLVETAILALESGDEERAKKYLALLIAMYHDPEHVNENGWYDFEVEHFTEVGLYKLFNLATTGFLLGIDELPDVRNLTEEDIFSMIRA